MAMVPHSQTDLVYLPDHGFVGEEGALRILPQITRQIHRINVSRNPLGLAGITILFKGLTTLRARHSSPELGLGIWGLKEINFATTNAEDEALDCVLSYAKKDGFLRAVYMQGNEIRLEKAVESIALSINMSRLDMLSLTNNINISTEGLTKLLRLLDSPHLRELHLAACRLPPSMAPILADFIRSPRSRNITHLLLHGNQLGGAGVTQIIDAIEESNFSLIEAGLLANASPPSDAPDQAVKSKDEASVLEHQVHVRLPEILKRNRLLTKRVRSAASRMIAPARIILNARPLSDAETARNVVSAFSASNPEAYNAFRLLDLPEDVIQDVVRHTSGDPGALSQAQYTRLRLEASDKKALKTATDARNRMLRGKSVYDEKGALEQEQVRAEWLKKGKWDKWERD
ncbi:hypothetical protein B9479_002104 [Cryptococcus floricola]|uniref:RNI-like protein n=1 Tax=Cryptococcus floricola TaxID=2591691 RepID=A0A5D3B3J8_9TREE|nr:hypothetical protein B9479_002104 [Cryptococcus floricola]